MELPGKRELREQILHQMDKDRERMSIERV